MPGTYVAKTKAFNRHFVINFGKDGNPEWYDIITGISSRGNNISESPQDYYYMSGRGVADSDVTTQTIERTFAGNRFLDDPAQNAIFIDRLNDMENRSVEVYEYYDNMPDDVKAAKGNGWKYRATIAITDDGSGDTAARETIGFSLRQQGVSERGIVTVTGGDDPVYSFTAIPKP